MHLGEAMKALQAGDTAGAKMHMEEADIVIGILCSISSSTFIRYM
jgi:hypothetical protein